MKEFFIGQNALLITWDDTKTVATSLLITETSLSGEHIREPIYGIGGETLELVEQFVGYRVTIKGTYPRNVAHIPGAAQLQAALDSYLASDSEKRLGGK